MTDLYEVYAIKYATRGGGRTRADSFLLDAHSATPHTIDYFVWVIRNNERTIVVDTGYDAKEGSRRKRPVFREPADCLADFHIPPDSIDTVIVTHLHYDHAGSLYRFPNAKFHLQAAEMAYATGPCMCEDYLREPFTGEHVCEMVRNVFSGRVIFHDGDAEIAPGVSVHAMGGHSKGLQSVRVRTDVGYMMLASDASHFYENFLHGRIFPIVVDTPQMLKGFSRLKQLSTSTDLVVPGHDPLVCELFPKVAGSDAVNAATVYRLDKGPFRSVSGMLE